MKSIVKFAALGAVLAASAPLAFATPIAGGSGVEVVGTDSFDSTSITFDPSTGYVFTATGSMAPFTGTTAELGSFSTSTAVGDTLFTATSATAGTLTFMISALTAFTDNGSLYVSGTGTFTETGYDVTAGTFTLTSSNDIITGFQLNGGVPATVAATPEPNSLLLMGTGLLGAAGLIFTRRRNTADAL